MAGRAVVRSCRLVVREIIRALRRVNQEETVSMLIAEQNAAMTLELAEHMYPLETGRAASAKGTRARLHHSVISAAREFHSAAITFFSIKAAISAS